jgi:MFS transporter, DHA1 family, inner membrane transport protein
MSTETLLILLSVANFVIGMGAFVVVGVLPPIAADFAISSPTAGWLMTAYALVYAVSSPILVAITGSLDRGRLLVGGMILFTLGAAGAAAAPSFAMLLAARGLMALGGGLVTPVAASIGAALVPAEARGRALATVFGGLTLAQVFGVPAGAWLGFAYGWRAAFIAVALLSALGVVVLAKFAPRSIKAPATALATLGDVLREPRLMTAVSFTALFAGGLYVFYTYFAPFIQTRHQLERNGVTIVLVVYGLGAALGNFLGGGMTDRIGAVRVLAILCLAQLVIMPFLTLAPTPLAITVATLVVWAIFSWSFMAAQQSRLVALDPPRTPVLFALNASAIYLGGAIGSLIGGLTLRQAGLPALGPVGAVLALGALATLALVERMKTPRKSPPPRAG